MRYFSYRNRLRLRAFLIGLAIALAVLLLAAAGLLIYLQRYVVYTADGAHLDFSSREPDQAGGAPLFSPDFVVEQPEPIPDASLVVKDSADEDETPTVTRVSGYYVTVEMLSNTAAVSAALADVTTPTAVLMDVKSIYGNYYYSSAVSGAQISSLVDPSAVGALIQELAARPEIHLIARLPAFRDSAFALTNQSCGLPLSSGALWVDSDNCYWLDPANNTVLSHLEGIALELQSLGFDEVVFRDFAFPDSDNIVYDEDRTEAVLSAADRLSANLSLSEIRFSLEVDDSGPAAHAARVFAAADNGADALALAETMSEVFPVPEESLVFLTNSRDTRFESYGVLRPLLETEVSE